MFTHLRANVVGYLALFVALGGTSYAAVQLPKNSVSAKQITTGAVRTAEVKDGSLTSADFSSGVIPSVTWARTNGFTLAPTTTAKLETITTFTVPAPGRLVVWGRMILDAPDAEIDCPSSGLIYELFVDGVPVAGTFVSTDTSIDVGQVLMDRQGVSVPVAAGARTIQAGALCTDGTPTLVDVGDQPSVGAILVDS
jgi:hypothetical protein